MHEIEIWVLVDECGSYVCSHDADNLDTLYDEHVGENSAVARRVVKVSLKVPAIKPLELSGEVPDLPSEPARLSVA